MKTKNPTKDTQPSNETDKDLDTPRFRIEVEPNDIAVAMPKNSGHCMIADALKKSFRKKFKRSAWAVHVDLQTIRLTDREKGFRYIYLTPPKGQANLLRFDHGKPVEPFSIFLKGGQIIPMSRAKTQWQGDDGKTRSHNKQKAIQQFKAKRLKIVQQRAFHPSSGQTSGGMIATQVGGEAPPTAVLAGQRRQYGLKHTLSQL